MEDIEFAEQTADRSTARCPNGTGDFTDGIIPTYLAYNTCETLGSSEIAESKASIQVYPNPTSASITVSSDEIISSIEVFNFMGQTMASQRNLSIYGTVVDCSKLPAGVYMVKVNDRISKKFLVNK